MFGLEGGFLSFLKKLISLRWIPESIAMLHLFSTWGDRDDEWKRMFFMTLMVIFIILAVLITFSIAVEV